MLMHKSCAARSSNGCKACRSSLQRQDVRLTLLRHVSWFEDDWKSEVHLCLISCVIGFRFKVIEKSSFCAKPRSRSRSAANDGDGVEAEDDDGSCFKARATAKDTSQSSDKS